MAERAGRGALAAAALLSGAAGLAYQVLWTRQLTLVLGHTVAAVSTVLAAFMGGLGLGHLLAARRVDAMERRALARAYAGLEGGIAALALLLLALVRLPLPAPSAWRFAFGALAVAAPATLMGATLPALAALARPPARRLGAAAGGLYAANTAGAVAGSLATALVLLPALGVRLSTVAAALLNLAAAALAWGWAQRQATDAHEAETPAPTAPRKRARERPATVAEAVPRAAVLAVLALSGLAALADEVAWTRALVLLIGPTTYAFAFIVAAVIAGLAVGSALAARWADGLARPGRALALVALAAAAASVALVRVLGTLPLPAAALARAHADHAGRLLAVQLGAVLALLLVPSLLFGAAFPLAVRLLGRERGRAGEALGLAGAANTAGAIAGALLAGFVALPALGLRRTLLAAAAGHAAAGMIALVPALRGGGRWAALAAGALGVVLAPRLAPPWDAALFAGGPYKYALYTDPAEMEEELRSGELVFYRDGRAATVSVKRLGGALSLSVDGKVDATNTADMLTQRLLAHLPLLLHGSAQRVLVIGLGSGVTAGAALAHGLPAVDAVEIEPEVAAAARLFARANGGVMDDPRLHLVLGDGRRQLQAAAAPYDVVISEPSNPWMAGVANLFSRDFFALARSKLAFGGLFCQWAHVYNMSPADLRVVIGSFTDVFPEATLFVVNEGDILLLGARDRFPTPTPEALRERMARPAVRADLAAVGVRSPFGLAVLHALSGEALRAFAAGAPRHTDDRPRLEFSTPRFLHADTAEENRRRIGEAAARASVPEPFATLRMRPRAEQLLEHAGMLEGSAGFSWARDAYADALDLDPASLPAVEGLVRTARRRGTGEELVPALRRLADGAGPVTGRVGLALVARGAGRGEEALRWLEEAAARDPRSPRVLVLGAEVQQGTGNAEAAKGLARAALALDPGNADAEALLGSLALAADRAEEARAHAEAALQRDPRQTDALEVAAITRAEAGDRAGARRAFEELLQADPESWSALNNYGVFELAGGD
ncbi:MAG TPA: fused MFS/spermidine synthase, partial [Vicinamibacteria bacterium]